MLPPELKSSKDRLLMQQKLNTVISSLLVLQCQKVIWNFYRLHLAAKNLSNFLQPTMKFQYCHHYIRYAVTWNWNPQGIDSFDWGWREWHGMTFVKKCFGAASYYDWQLKIYQISHNRLWNSNTGITIFNMMPPETEILKGSTLLAGDGENDTAATTREQYSSATL